VSNVPGATVVGVERYDSRQGDASSAIERLLGPEARSPAVDSTLMPPPALPTITPPFDALLIADGGAQLRAASAALPYYGVAAGSARLLGTMRWSEDEGAYREEPLQGAWIAAWEPRAINQFSARFRTTYGRTPTPLAVLAYDATALAALLATAPGRYGSEQLTDPQGFQGGSGIFRLRPDGLAEHGLAILEIGSGGTRVVEPAPASFTGEVASR
jgi:hypothetical protein